MFHPPQLAGVRFQTVTAPQAPGLPRMDIAGFVGFAAQGPLHVPVMVEDVPRFRALFGADPALAWDEDAGRFATAHLGQAVEAFFAQGGRRAWIVRVAGDAAETAQFAVPGLLGATDSAPAAFSARSPGTWAHALSGDAVFVRRRQRIAPGAIFAPGDPVQLIRQSDGIAPGDVLELRLPGETLSAFLPVTGVDTQGTLTFETPIWRETDPYGSPDLIAAPDGPARYAAWDAGSPGFAPALYLIRMTLSVRQGDGPVLRMRDLALGAAHPRWFGNLQDDATALAAGDAQFGQRSDPDRTAFLAEALSPRFPLAGASQGNAVWLPQTLTDPMPLTQTGDGADGLDTFTAADFLDADLRRAGFGALKAEADTKILVNGDAAQGIHALWPLEEVALLALPDAVHRPWIQSAPPPQDLPVAPVLDAPQEQGDGTVRLDWTPVPDATGYQLIVATDPDFTDTLAEIDSDDTEAFYALPANCPIKLFFRVRGLVGGGITAWSNTQGAWLPDELAGPCGRPPILHTTLDATPAGSPDDAYLLTWGTATEVEVERSAGPAFLVPERAFAGSASSWLEDQPIGTGTYLRVRQVGPGAPHPWSNTVYVPPLPRSDFTLEPKRSYDGADLVALHAAALRMCAARGDLTVTLSVPDFHDPTAHLAALRPGPAGTVSVAGVPPLTLGERPVFSFGALTHPWILMSNGDIVLPQPPDGVVLGHMAVTDLDKGAWIAAANRPTIGALGLTEVYTDAERLTLEGAGINPVVRDPRGILLLSDWTLSDDSALAHMNIRRLLILLRRLALREGRQLVFEPNGAALRQLVQSRFDQVMERLYLRGAFRGARQAEAFQVITDASINTPQSIDAGRFIVELRVAPSRPLAFLRVQLFQNGGGGLATREALT
ncbi:MAG: hypothetical protein AAGK30_00345 [Pseudomonadota bacterium]